MQLRGRNLPLRRTGRRNNLWRLLLCTILIVGLLWGYSLLNQGQIQRPFEPSPTPTRNPISWAEEAKAQFAAGRLGEAALAYNRALEIDPKNVDYWVGLARVRVFAEQYPEAFEAASSAVLAAPESAKARAIEAWAYYYLGQPDQARAAAVQAIALDNNYAPAHAYYSFILNDAQNWDQGFREAQAALQLDPTLLESHLAMGYSNESVGSYDGAIKRYLDALAINPNVISVYRRIALNYRALKDYEQAILYFSKANQIDPNNIQPYLDLSRTFIQIDELGTAEQYLLSALELEPANPNIHGRLGALYFKRKNYESAEPELRLAVEGGLYEAAAAQIVTVEPMPLDARSVEYYYTLGNLLAYYRRCGPAEAPFFLNQALNFAPDDATIRGSYDESMGICATFLAGTALPDATPTAVRSSATAPPPAPAASPTP